MKHLLVIDDEPGHRLMIRAVMEDAGWQVSEAGSGEEGTELFKHGAKTANVVLVDMKMPGMDGQTTLTKLHQIRPEVPVILLTAFGTVGAAVEAMKKGAFDYLTKPTDNDELVLTLTRAYEYNRLSCENERLRTELSGEEKLTALVGKSNVMRQLRDIIKQAGPSEATVLIYGESGTGKELIAEALHTTSTRSKHPLIKVNCAALPAQLLESELFGYEKGAFTGAIKDKPGRFQLANGGTLFLDEIGELPLDLQAKLLRVLQERTVEPLGSVRSRPVDVRILAATNRHLRTAVAAGTFREDLFFRLNVLEIDSPSLRSHLEDLPVLVTHFLRILSEKNRKKVRGVTPRFLQALSLYHWPGNVRELENILERALILSRSDELDIDILPAHMFDIQASPFTTQLQHEPQRTPQHPQTLLGGTPPVGSLTPAAAVNKPQGQPQEMEETEKTALSGSLLDEAECKALLQALHEFQGHREKTAEALGISRRTLQYKLKKFGLNKR